MPSSNGTNDSYAPEIVVATIAEIASNLRAEFGIAYRGLLLVGSYATATAHDASDLDLHGVVEAPYAIGRGFLSNGFQVDLMIHPRWFLEQTLKRDPFMVERLASGRVVDGDDAALVLIVRAARAALPLQRPPLDAFTASAYALRLRTLEKKVQAAPSADDRSFIRACAVRVATEALFGAAGIWHPKPHRTLTLLASLDEEGARLVRAELNADRHAGVEPLLALTAYALSRIGPATTEWSLTTRL